MSYVQKNLFCFSQSFIFIISAEICEDIDRNVLSLPVDFKLNGMLVGEQKTQSFYVRSSSLDTRYFQLMVCKFFFILYHLLKILIC